MKRISLWLCWAILLPALFIIGTNFKSTAQSKKVNNPITSISDKPVDFNSITVADINEATQQTIANAKLALTEIYAIQSGKHTFENTLLAIDNIGDKSVSTLLCLNVLSNANPDSALRNTAKKSVETMGKFFNEIELDEKLYLAVKQFSKTREASKLTGARKLLLKETLDDYERNGFALPADKRAVLQDINNKISKLQLDFNTNIAAYKDQLLVAEADMKGLPEDFIKSRKKDGDKYIITLDGPSYNTFMKYAESESMRKALLLKYNNRATDKNLGVLQQLLTNG